MLRYVFRLGDRMKILSIPQLNITDDKYHTIVVKRVGNRARLQIDYDGKVEGTTGGIHKLLNMGGGSFFTGGLPNVTEVGKVRLLILTISLPGATDELFRIDVNISATAYLSLPSPLLIRSCHHLTVEGGLDAQLLRY